MFYFEGKPLTLAKMSLKNYWEGSEARNQGFRVLRSNCEHSRRWSQSYRSRPKNSKFKCRGRQPPLSRSVNDLILFSILSKPIKSIRSTVYSSPIRLLSFLWPTISNLDASSGSGSPGKVGGGSISPLYPISLGQKLGTLSFFMYKIPVSPRNHLCLPPL